MPSLQAKQTRFKLVAALRRGAWLLLLLSILPLPVLAAPPEVFDDYFTVLEDSRDNDPANRLDVLFNDDPLPGAPFEIVGLFPSPATHGTVQIVENGSFVTYEPDPDFDGLAEFDYVVDDGSGINLQATVHVTVQGINDRPDVQDDTATTAEDTPVAIDVLDNDSDVEGDLNPATVIRVAGPTDGRVTIDGTTGVITYRPNDDWNGIDTFTYRVCDYGSPLPRLCDYANVRVTVTPVPDRPIADAGPDQSVPTLSTVTLDGSGSYDPDGPVELIYQWQQVSPMQPQVALSDPTAQSPTFVAPDDPVILVFSLHVIDQDSNISTNDANVRITVTNQTPVADAGGDQQVTTETTVTLDGSGSYDPDHDDLTYEWDQTAGPIVILSSPSAISPTFTAPATETSLTFRLRVRDEYSALSPWDSVTINVYETPIFELFLPFVVSDYAAMPDLVVKTLTATRNNIQVVLENQGTAAVMSGFYVDVYVAPLRPPVGAHEGWDTAGVSSGRGLVWAIEVSQTPNPSQGIVAPIMPGQTLTLSFNDAFYQPDYSSITWPLTPGTPIYAQADSFPAPTPHNGLVLETHEYYGQPYNNITGPVNSTAYASSAIAPATRPFSSLPASLPPRP